MKTFSFVFHEQRRCCLATSIQSTVDKNRNSTAELDEVYFIFFFFSRIEDLQSFIHSLPGNEGKLNEFGVSVFLQFHPSHMQTKEKTSGDFFLMLENPVGRKVHSFKSTEQFKFIQLYCICTFCRCKLAIEILISEFTKNV